MFIWFMTKMQFSEAKMVFFSEWCLFNGIHLGGKNESYLLTYTKKNIRWIIELKWKEKPARKKIQNIFMIFGKAETFSWHTKELSIKEKNYNLTSLRIFMDYKLSLRNFLGGPVVKSPPCNAAYLGSIPGQGTKIPHATGQLNPGVAPKT